MSFFSNGSFKKEYVEYDNRYLDQITISLKNGEEVQENIRFLLNIFHGGLPFVDHNNIIFISESLKLGLKASDIEGFFLNLKEPHYLLPYFEVFDDMKEYFTINTESQALLRLFYKYKDRIAKDRLHELRKELVSYKSLARKDIRNTKDEDFIMCVEKVFNIRKMCLTTPHEMSNLSLSEQREGIINGIVYTLSVFYGEPDSFFYTNIPSEWRNSADFHGYVNYFLKHMQKIKILTECPLRFGDLIHEYVKSIDNMWIRYYSQYNHLVERSKNNTRGCKIKNTGTRIKYTTNERYKLTYGDNEEEAIDICTLSDLDKLVDTVPEYLPVILGGTTDIVRLCDMNKGHIIKRGDDTIVSMLGSNFVMKCVVSAESVFNILEVITEYIFSRMIHNMDVFKPIRNSIPYVYTIRDDIRWNNEMFSVLKRTFPTTIIMERKEGQTLFALLPKLDKKSMTTVLFKVFSILDLLHREVEFTHYDLHSGNIIVNEETLDVAIIDMGRCRFKTEDGWVGRYFSYETSHYAGVYMDRAYPASDIFRLLMSCWEGGHHFLDTIINFMFSMEPTLIRKMYAHSLFSLHYSDKFKDMTYSDVLQLLDPSKI